MKLLVVFGFVAAIVAIGFCSQSGGAQDAPELAFTSASQALGEVGSSWDKLDKEIDGGFLKSKKAAADAAAGATGDAKSSVVDNAMDDLRMQRVDLSMLVLRAELINRDRTLAGSFYQQDFPQRDRDQVNGRNASRATGARKRIADGYESARKAILALR